jgi:hypothetical protein
MSTCGIRLAYTTGMTGITNATTVDSVITEPTKFTAWRTGVTSGLSGLTDTAIFARITADLGNVQTCLQTKVNDLRRLPTTISGAQEQILDLNDKIAEAETHATIARDRVAFIRDPSKGTSYYESWFPLGRPMHPISLIILIGIDIFLCVFALLMIASAYGVDLSVAVSASSTFNQAFAQVSYPAMILVGLLILFITLYATRTYAN